MKRILSGLLLVILLFLPLISLAGDTFPQPTKPGEQGSQVKLLQKKLIEAALLQEGADSAVYDESTRSAVAVFQAENGIRVTGVADMDTLLVLFRKPKPVPGVTQVPEWYGGGSDLIPFGAVFEIKDVRSGTVFSVYRMMGESHLDAEPLTKEDTEKMKKAYPKWSWDRRPILIRYEGEVFAASMNGMPHSYHSNKKSGFPGHFCIHFAFSRGDSSQRLDANHQQAVLEAAATQWYDPPTHTNLILN
ncbi:MAG: peptidoglycan-binding domain-containing protein [Christensenellales bacterium]|jgi:peptidoglycan hydrolase-like protein with peptidoglycan-binding domain